MISFTKLPIYVADTNETYHLFDMLLPSEYSEQKNLTVLTILCKLRPLFTNNKNVDSVLSHFLDAQSYITFNYIYIPDVKDESRISKDNLKWIIVGDRKFSLNNQETSDFYFHSICCMIIMNIYKNL
jgi:hypothetical protein